MHLQQEETRVPLTASPSPRLDGAANVASVVNVFEAPDSRWRGDWSACPDQSDMALIFSQAAT